MGNIANSRKKETRPEQTEFKNMDPQPKRPEQTEFKSMDPQPIEKSVNFNTAVGKVIHLKKDLKPGAFKNKTTIHLKSLIADFIKKSRTIISQRSETCSKYVTYLGIRRVST